MDTAVVAAIIAGSVGVLSAALQVASDRRVFLSQVISETAQLTTGPVAEARHTVGSALESASPGNPVLMTTDEVKAFFQVLWCFDRLSAFHRSSATRARPLVRVTRSQKLLLLSSRAAIRTWVGYLRTWDGLLCAANGSVLGYSDARSGLDELATALDSLEKQGK